MWPLLGRWHVFALRRDWERAEAVGEALSSRTAPLPRWQGFSFRALDRLYRGRSAEALELLEQAHDSYERPVSFFRAASSSYAAHVLLERDEAARALEAAEAARREGAGNRAEWEGLFFSALAEQRLGRAEAARRTAETLRQATAAIPGPKETRRYHHLLGELALARGEIREALEELRRAESTLAPRGFLVRHLFGIPQHVPIWFSLGKAQLAAGELEEAARYFEKVLAAESDGLWWPILYVRSFYFLGRIHEEQGRGDKARELYRRFLESWEQGDLDRSEVREALSRSTV